VQRRIHRSNSYASADQNSRCRLLLLPLAALMSTPPSSRFLFSGVFLILVASSTVRNRLSTKIVGSICACARARLRFLPCFPCPLLFIPRLLCSLAGCGKGEGEDVTRGGEGRREGRRADECTVPVSSWNPTRFFPLIRDLRVGSWFGRRSGRFIRRLGLRSFLSSLTHAVAFSWRCLGQHWYQPKCGRIAAEIF
jgi:hypothetical protein